MLRFWGDGVVLKSSGAWSTKELCQVLRWEIRVDKQALPLFKLSAACKNRVIKDLCYAEDSCMRQLSRNFISSEAGLEASMHGQVDRPGQPGS